MLFVNNFSPSDNPGFDLCHVILYSAVAGYFYVGLRYIDPQTGNVISPYRVTQFGSPPANVDYGLQNDCFHMNIRGNVYAGGVDFRRNGKLYSQEIYSGGTPNGSCTPGFWVWANNPNDFVSVPDYGSWSDGRPAYINYMQDFPTITPLFTNQRWFNWRGQHFGDIFATGDTNRFSWSVRWDKNFTERPDEFGSGTLHWNAEQRIFVPDAPVGYGACVAYALPVRKETLSYSFSGYDAKLLFGALTPTFERMPTLEYVGKGPVRKAVENFNALDMNNVENSQSLTLKDILPIEAIRLLRKNPIKAAADLYLWYKYSFAPNVSDLKKTWSRLYEVLSVIDRQQKSYGTTIATGTYMSLPCNTRYNACVIGNLNGRTELQKVAQKLSGLGLEINAQNVWDLIPFSFVLDWFLPISDVFGEMDYENNVLLNKWNISLVEQSTRTQCDLSIGSLIQGLTGSVSLIRYARTYGTQLPMNQYNFGDKEPQTHIWDGAALIISNWKS